MKSLSLSQPHAIVMVGIPGSGKTFFAEKFAETFGAPFVASQHFIEFAKDEKAADSLAAYAMELLAKTGQSMILEVRTASRMQRSDLTKQLKKFGYTPLYVWVQTDPQTAASRSLKAHAMSKEEHEQHIKQFSAPHASEKVLVISGKHTYATQARAVLKRLSAPRAELASRKPVAERHSTNIIVR